LQSSSGGRGIGESVYVSTPVSTEYKPASWQLDAEGAKELLAAKKAQASGAKQEHTPGPVELPGLPPTLVVDSAEVESSESSEEDVLEKEWTAETKQAAATRPQVSQPRIPKHDTRHPTTDTHSPKPATHTKPETQNPKPETRSPEPEPRTPYPTILTPKLFTGQARSDPKTRSPNSQPQPPLPLPGLALAPTLYPSQRLVIHRFDP
jgi:hypothetical protein